jgi:hypothetical protein
MKNLPSRPDGRNHPEPGSLFAWAERQRIRALPFPARRIAQRHGFTPATAGTIAELAYGLGGVR